MAPGTSLCRGLGGAERGGPGRGDRAPLGRWATTHLLLLHEAHEGGTLDLHGLPLPVVQSQDEVEKVGLPQVGWRLLLEVSPGQTHSTGTIKTRVSSSPDDTASLPPPAPRAGSFPDGTWLGSPGAEHPPRRAVALPCGPGERRAAARPRRNLAAPGARQDPTRCRPAASPERRATPTHLPGTHQPSPAAVSARSRPCMAREPRSAPPARCPVEQHRSCHFSNSARSCHPNSAHVPYLSVSVPRTFPPLAGVEGKHREGSRGDNLKYFRVVPCRNFPFLRGLQTEGCGARRETPRDVNIKLLR